MGYCDTTISYFSSYSASCSCSESSTSLCSPECTKPRDIMNFLPIPVPPIFSSSYHGFKCNSMLQTPKSVTSILTSLGSFIQLPLQQVHLNINRYQSNRTHEFPLQTSVFLVKANDTTILPEFIILFSSHSTSIHYRINSKREPNSVHFSPRDLCFFKNKKNKTHKKNW